MGLFGYQVGGFIDRGDNEEFRLRRFGLQFQELGFKIRCLLRVPDTVDGNPLGGGDFFQVFGKTGTEGIGFVQDGHGLKIFLYIGQRELSDFSIIGAHTIDIIRMTGR